MYVEVNVMITILRDFRQGSAKTVGNILESQWPDAPFFVIQGSIFAGIISFLQSSRTSNSSVTRRFGREVAEFNPKL
jgi:hypothetical protein